jgi:hypothetical protein
VWQNPVGTSAPTCIPQRFKRKTHHCFLVRPFNKHARVLQSVLAFVFFNHFLPLLPSTLSLFIPSFLPSFPFARTLAFINSQQILTCSVFLCSYQAEPLPQGVYAAAANDADADADADDGIDCDNAIDFTHNTPLVSVTASSLLADGQPPFATVGRDSVGVVTLSLFIYYLPMLSNTHSSISFFSYFSGAVCYRWTRWRLLQFRFRRAHSHRSHAL